MRKERKAKVNLLVCIVAVLLCATLFSTYLVGGLYAKFTAHSRGSDSARVAAFNITGAGTIFGPMIEANVTPGEMQTATLTITNSSEVVVDYSIQVTNVTNNITPLQFKLVPADDNTALAPVTLQHENGISTNTVRRSPGEYSDTYNLIISWEANNEPEKDLAFIGMIDYISVSVTATQVD